jgi:replicative DNA helicase
MTGIPTGIAKFDKFSYGMQKGDLIVIGAQSSQGKTSLALTIANNSTGRFGSKGAIFNLEMTNEQVMARMISQATGLNSKDLLNKKLNKDEYELYNEGLGHFNERELFLVKNSSISYERLSATIRKLKIKKDIDFVVVDFLQRLRPSQGMTKVDFYAYVAQKLKDIALELGIVIILLSQLNRDKDRPEPTMDRLRSSGEIEEAADTILLLWRPEYYKIDDIEYKGTSISSHGLAWMKIEKGRNIGTGEILLKFHPSTTKFEDYEEENRVDVESYNPHAGFESRDLEHENDLPF